ncbi:isoprenylcysteine carboxylmethyltransferase family protein [Motilimonas cestriensis]|uniref:Isoprenylcysteine carboxylmethyltransferase family protein n=1 Tax=Motilimonas cestriensis TaxID=2742685 RepID=A0ABS8WDE5_9GAMM|nr:isoprenylcysteine carboxylmethyltransferase family protein [Motilimonas cestriensis]MCE2595728.1 isoprenylcysteine carboxylmethyltransferase family protein [Motilimonas cestriensis]
MTLSLKVLPVGVFLVAMVIAKLVSLWLPIASLPALVSMLGGGVTLIIGLIFGLAGVQLFRRSDTTVNPMHPEQATKLVTTGVYQYSRNPMYLGLLACLLTWAFYLQTLSGFFAVPLFVLYMNQFQIKPEEMALTRLFGDEFTQYCQRVRRWL